MGTSFFGERFRRVAAEFLIFLKAGKFYFFPSARNLMLDLWYGYFHMRAVRADTTADIFLNDRVLQIEEAMANPHLAWKKRRWYLRFLYAVADPELYSMIITFLETPAFSSALSAGLIDKIERVRKPGLGGTRPESVGVVGSAGPAGVEGPAGPVEAAGSAGSVEAKGLAGSVEGAGPVGKRNFNAKTYFIAAQLHYELKGKQAEFESLSRRMYQMAEFVKKQFHTDHLPGTFYDLRGYSYKTVLLGDNESRKGQLKPFFRQLSENPGVFGNAIAQRAQKILEEFF